MNKKLYVTYLILSILGFITSLYLTIQHFIESQGACDINAAISCSLVNSSTYSEIFGVPIAIFGMLWFMALFLLAWNYFHKKSQKQDKMLLYWNYLGFLAVIYLITAEVWLRAICPFCTVVHVIVLLSLGLSIYISRKSSFPPIIK